MSRDEIAEAQLLRRIQFDQKQEYKKCKLCKEKHPPSSVHRHDGRYICDNCWDERLRNTE